MLNFMRQLAAAANSSALLVKTQFHMYSAHGTLLASSQTQPGSPTPLPSALLAAGSPAPLLASAETPMYDLTRVAAFHREFDRICFFAPLRDPTSWLSSVPLVLSSRVFSHPLVFSHLGGSVCLTSAWSS